MFSKALAPVFWLMSVVLLFQAHSLINDASSVLADRILVVTEAVAIIEAAAQTIEEDMNILRNIADREECYQNWGEWSDEYGCVLEEVQ